MEMTEANGKELLRISRRSVGQLCCMTTWTFLGLWSMSTKWKNAERRNTLGKGTGQGKLRRIFQERVVPKSKLAQV